MATQTFKSKKNYLQKVIKQFQNTLFLIKSYSLEFVLD